MGRKSTGSNPMVLQWAGSPQVPILPDPKGLGARAFQSHGLEMGRKSTGSNPMVLQWAGSPQVPILQYFQIHRSYQNGWSFSIPRFTGHTRMLRPSVFPDSRGLRMLGPLMPKSISSDTQNKRYKCRHPKYNFR